MSSLVWWILALVALQRLSELALNRRNQRRLLAAGGRLVPEDGYRRIVPVHVAWFVLMAVEALVGPWAGTHAVTWALLGGYGLAEALRLWTMVELGERWTTRVIVIDGAEPVRGGPYRWLDHPIYLAVSIELVALPLAFGLPVTAVLVGVANLWALRHRIRVEEQALAKAAERSGDVSGEPA